MKVLENVVLYKIDAEAGEGPELAKEHAVKSYPNFVFANVNVETMDRWVGYEKDHFIENLEGALADPTTIDEKRARFAKSPTELDAGKLARYHGSRQEHKEAVTYYRKAAEIGEADYASLIFENVAYGARHEHFTVEQAADAAKPVIANANAEEIVEVYFIMNWLGGKKDMPDLGVPYIEPALAASANSADEKMQKRHQRLEIDHAMKVLGDKEKGLELKVASLPEGWKDEATQLNGFAWWCFENLVNLEEAELLARRGAELAPAGTERAMILDTVAEICNARGNCDDAVELMHQAVENAPESEYYKEQLERFQQIRAEQAN